MILFVKHLISEKFNVSIVLSMGFDFVFISVIDDSIIVCRWIRKIVRNRN